MHTSRLEFYCRVLLLFRKVSWTTRSVVKSRVKKLACRSDYIPHSITSSKPFFPLAPLCPSPMPSLINKVRHMSASLTSHWLFTKLGATHQHPHFQKENKLAPIIWPPSRLRTATHLPLHPQGPYLVALCLFLPSFFFFKSTSNSRGQLSFFHSSICREHKKVPQRWRLFRKYLLNSWRCIVSTWAHKHSPVDLRLQWWLLNKWFGLYSFQILCRLAVHCNWVS